MRTALRSRAGGAASGGIEPPLGGGRPSAARRGDRQPGEMQG